MKIDRFSVSAAALLVVGLAQADGVRAATVLSEKHLDVRPVVAVLGDWNDRLLVGGPHWSADARPAVEDRLWAAPESKPWQLAHDISADERRDIQTAAADEEDGAGSTVKTPGVYIDELIATDVTGQETDDAGS